MWFPQCRMSNLRTGYGDCQYHSKFHVNFKMVECQMSNLSNGPRRVGDTFSLVDGLHVGCRLQENTVSLCRI